VNDDDVYIEDDWILLPLLSSRWLARGWPRTWLPSFIVWVPAAVACDSSVYKCGPVVSGGVKIWMGCI